MPVCVFARAPRPGEAKTRLARHLGAERAAALAAAFLADVWRVVSGLPWARPVLAATEHAPRDYGLGDVETWPQGEGDLGARMERVLLRGLEDAGEVVLIGADLPALPASHLDAAHSLLGAHDVVLGPAEDGGFWLLAARRWAAGALDAVTWSAPTTRAQTATALAHRGLDVAAGVPWFDVDEVKDLERLRCLLRDEPHRAPRTHAVLGP